MFERPMYLEELKIDDTMLSYGRNISVHTVKAS